MCVLDVGMTAEMKELDSTTSVSLEKQRTVRIVQYENLPMQYTEVFFYEAILKNSFEKV